MVKNVSAAAFPAVVGDYISPEWDEDRWKGEGHHFVIPSGLPVASKFYPLEQ